MEKNGRLDEIKTATNSSYTQAGVWGLSGQKELTKVHYFFESLVFNFLPACSCKPLGVMLRPNLQTLTDQKKCDF